MSSKKKLWLMLFACAVLVFGVSACGGDDDGGGGETTETPTETTETPTETTAAEPTSIRVATFPVAGNAGVPLAISEGLFEENGLEAELVDVAVPNIVASVISGENQFGTASAGGLLQAAEQGIEVRIVSPAYYAAEGEQGVYVAADSDIQSIEDLAGKQIATGSLQSVAHAGMLVALEDAGVDIKSVEVITFDFPNIPAALLAGNLEAGHMAEPLITVNGDDVRPVIENIYPYGELPAVTYWFTSADFLESDPEAVAGFQAAVNEAQDRAGSDDEVARSAIAGFTEIDPQVLENMTLPGFGSDLKIDQLQEQAEVMEHFGFITQIPDLGELVVEPGE